MNNKRFWLACVVIFVYISIFEWALHGGLLAEAYQASAHIWRSQETMATYMPWMSAGQLLFAGVFCWLYACTTCPSTIKGGAWYGAVMGLLTVSVSLVYYAVLPISLGLLAAWALGGVIEMVIAGIILSRIYPKT